MLLANRNVQPVVVLRAAQKLAPATANNWKNSKPSCANKTAISKNPNIEVYGSTNDPR
jgi:hypothetical protein